MLKQKSLHLIAAVCCLFQFIYQPVNASIKQVEIRHGLLHSLISRNHTMQLLLIQTELFIVLKNFSSQTTTETLICFIRPYNAFHHTTSKFSQRSIKQCCAWFIIFSYPQELSPGKGLGDNRTTQSQVKLSILAFAMTFIADSRQ